MAELRAAGYVETHRQQGARGRWITRLDMFDTTSTERALPAFGPTCEDSASAQVPPNASRPAAGGAAFKRKDGKSSARVHARGRPESKPARVVRRVRQADPHGGAGRRDAEALPSVRARASSQPKPFRRRISAMRSAIRPVADTPASVSRTRPTRSACRTHSQPDRCNPRGTAARRPAPPDRLSPGGSGRRGARHHRRQDRHRRTRRAPRHGCETSSTARCPE
jgi:hypothetical protein